MRDSAYKDIVLSRDGNIATVRLNRPEARNALNVALMSELTDVAIQLRSEADLRAVIICGADTVFSAGADRDMIAKMLEQPPAEMSPDDLMTLREKLRVGPDLCAAWSAIEVPTIAAIEGFCVGGAVSLVLACDFRIGSSTTMMSLPEVKLGMNMSWHTLPRLAALIGPSRAKHMTLFGDPINAERLSHWGLLDACVEAGTAEHTARDWAKRLAALPPLPVRMTLEAINASANLGHDAARFADRDQFLLTVMRGLTASG